MHFEPYTYSSDKMSRSEAILIRALEASLEQYLAGAKLVVIFRRTSPVLLLESFGLAPASGDRDAGFGATRVPWFRRGFNRHCVRKGQDRAMAACFGSSCCNRAPLSTRAGPAPPERVRAWRTKDCERSIHTAPGLLWDCSAAGAGLNNKDLANVSCTSAR